MRDQLIAAYLDWRNNYLSLDCYAEHNGLTVEQADSLLILAREVFTTSHPEA